MRKSKFCANYPLENQHSCDKMMVGRRQFIGEWSLLRGHVSVCVGGYIIMKHYEKWWNSRQLMQSIIFQLVHVDWNMIQRSLQT